MKTTEENVLVAPCGIYCGDCFAYKTKDNPDLLEAVVAKGVKREKLPCPGCRAVKGDCPVLNCTCETYACIESRNIDFCFECPEYPCDKLNPAADGANVFLHNLKIYNLCYIKEQGLAKFVEKAPEFQKKYYRGKLAVGKGPELE